MSKAPKYILNSWSDYLRYFKGLLTGKEKQQVEKGSLQDAFDAEAYDGMNSIAPDDLEQDILKLQQEIASRSRQKRSVLPIYMRYAAAVVLLLGVGIVLILVVRTGEQVQYMAEEISELDTLEQVVTDSFDTGIAYVPEEKKVEEYTQQTSPALSKPPPAPKVTEEVIIVEDEVEVMKSVDIDIEEEEAIDFAPLEFEEEAEIAYQIASASTMPAGAGMAKEAEATMPGESMDAAMMEQPATEPVEEELQDAVVISYGVSRKKETVSVMSRSSRSEIRLDQLEDKPCPVEGMDAFRDFVRKNINYAVLPEFNVAKHVKVKFTVSSRSEISNIEVLSSDGDAYTQEALRLLKEGPAWQPGTASNQIELRIKLEAQK